MHAHNLIAFSSIIKQEFRTAIIGVKSFRQANTKVLTKNSLVKSLRGKQHGELLQ